MNTGEPGAPQWAEIVRLCVHRLRRGTWYPVLDRSKPGFVTIDVGGTPFEVESGCVLLSDQRPAAWSVVRDNDPDAYFCAEYAVCPACFERAPLRSRQEELTCPACHQTHPVDWEGRI